jgi:1-phosphofructokinase
MILTVTLNPSLDRTIEVDALEVGAVHRAGHIHHDAGGKGVNIARALAANDHPALAVLPCGGSDGDEITRLLDRDGIGHVAVAIGDAVRTNITIAESDGTTTKLNTPGPTIDADELDALLDQTVRSARQATWVACSGSLPPGVGDDAYARLTAALHAVGCKVAIDTSGPALQLALPAGPDVIKPNVEELAELVDRPIHTLGDAADAARELCREGAAAVLVSLGPDGAVLVEQDRAVHGEAAVAVVRSTVGAGDATLAGFLAGGGSGPGALAEALAWGAAAVQLPGSRMPGPADLQRHAVQMHERLDRDRPLRDPHLPPPPPSPAPPTGSRATTERIAP